MTKKTPPPQPVIESRKWTSPDEINRGITKLKRRIEELEVLDVQAAVLNDTSIEEVPISNVRETIREVFGQYCGTVACGLA
jgi:hypothetical protein